MIKNNPPQAVSAVGQKELLTQRHVVQFFKAQLGYRYLGFWKERANNRNIEEKILSTWLKQQGHSDKIRLFRTSRERAHI